MKKMYQVLLMLSIVLGFYSLGSAVPTLQLGLPDGSGGYADYIANLSNPTETDTAIATGSPFTLLAGGVYKNNTLLLGGKYGTGADWSSFGYDSVFNGKGAVIMATVPDANTGNLTIGGLSAFYMTGGFENGFVMPNPPSNHDPVKDSSPDKKYLFFNIGNFLNLTGVVPNFADETGSANGEVKSLTVNTNGFDWIHFDVFALETHTQGGGKNTRIVSNLSGNPGSHDVTWKYTPPPPPPPPIPEPGTVFLLGAGLLGIGLYGRKRFKK